MLQLPHVVDNQPAYRQCMIIKNHVFMILENLINSLLQKFISSENFFPVTFEVGSEIFSPPFRPRQLAGKNPNPTKEDRLQVERGGPSSGVKLCCICCNGVNPSFSLFVETNELTSPSLFVWLVESLVECASIFSSRSRRARQSASMGGTWRCFCLKLDHAFTCKAHFQSPRCSKKFSDFPLISSNLRSLMDHIKKFTVTNVGGLILAT